MKQSLNDTTLLRLILHIVLKAGWQCYKHEAIP
jgi:hypothetical protein